MRDTPNCQNTACVNIWLCKFQIYVAVNIVKIRRDNTETVHIHHNPNVTIIEDDNAELFYNK